MDDTRQRIASVTDIPRQGLRFTYLEGPFEQEGILLRLPDGQIRAYKNQCRHLAIPLDERDPGTLWDPSGRNLVCAAHGALYRPDDGLCTAGPCRGSHLHELPVILDGGSVWLDTSKTGGFFA